MTSNVKDTRSADFTVMLYAPSRGLMSSRSSIRASPNILLPILTAKVVVEALATSTATAPPGVNNTFWASSSLVEV